jgi:predicted transglutaminase-like cysteine proteinase
MTLLFGTSAAIAVDAPGEATGNDIGSAHATEYGKALPPIGFVQFCARQPDECKPSGGRGEKFAMTAARWDLLHRVNTYVNDRIAPVSDQDLYGQPEYWAYPIDAGDCEDYLLLKRRYLMGLGFPGEALLITVVLDEKKEGHAVLTLAAADGDFILDNRRNDIRRWSDVEYSFLKRQSPRDPRVWVALEKTRTQAAGFVAGGDR